MVGKPLTYSANKTAAEMTSSAMNTNTGKTITITRMGVDMEALVTDTVGAAIMRPTDDYSHASIRSTRWGKQGG